MFQLNRGAIPLDPKGRIVVTDARSLREDTSAKISNPLTAQPPEVRLAVISSGLPATGNE